VAVGVCMCPRLLCNVYPPVESLAITVHVMISPQPRLYQELRDNGILPSTNAVAGVLNRFTFTHCAANKPYNVCLIPLLNI
jgi:hypothetical protein